VRPLFLTVAGIGLLSVGTCLGFVPSLDLRLFAEIAPQKVRLGMKSLQIAADRDFSAAEMRTRRGLGATA
jgi:hypothetical protein